MEQSGLKRIAAIHDLSGFGRCSLAVILPVMSAMGIQVCPVPTAVLSSHTGGLGDVVFRDLSDYIEPALEHYEKLGINFSCVYSGFLGSTVQVDHCKKFIASCPDAFIVVDPVMGDNGKPYKTCGDELRFRMSELVSEADMITPNMTEACMLLKCAYREMPLTHSEAKEMLVKLSSIGPEFVIITSVNMADGKTANIGYDKQRNAFWRVNYNNLPVNYPGTGDIFASVATGALLRGDSLPIAIECATKFLEYVINTTYSYGTDPRYGVMLEKCLAWLTQTHTLMEYTSI